MKMSNGTRTTVVPMHTGDMKQKTVRGILVQAGFTVNDVMNWRQESNVKIQCYGCRVPAERRRLFGRVS
ncbi:MAG: type II toxin-antitoxin system HicA family toxin [Synergistaceae bacterium]|nr:type II toxin-antitoxin system HicA family toxin [Synergistaceae bacterium]